MTAADIKKYSRRVRRRRFLRRALLLSLLLLALFLLIDRNFRPLVFSLAEARSAAMASQVLSGALAEAIEDGVTYEDLMNVKMDQSGQVALLSANTMAMNRLATRAGDAALRRLNNMSSERVTVPLGAVLGTTLFSGSGPGVPVSIVPIGSIFTDFATEFEAAGINQTRHKIWLEMRAVVRLVLPTGAKAVDVQTQILIAESIIVGDVPDSFINIPDPDSALNFAE